MLTIGTIQMERPLLLAPMEDVTDPPFRRICKRLGADIVYTEFISSEGLIRDARRSNQKLKLYDDERPVSIQIFGGNVDVMAEAARIAEAAGPDFLDINCGCWVKNVVARNAGAGLLRDLPAMEKIARTVVDAVSLPVTLKTRLGWDRSSIRIVEVAQMVEQAGIKALAIHCRTRDQGHEGVASWEYVEQVKRAVQIPVILNGDVKTPDDVRRAFETGADAVMIGRAAIANPWLFGDAKTYMATGELPAPRSFKERIDVALHHLEMSIDYKGDRYGIMEFRKYWGGYLHALPLASAVRKELVVMNDLEDIYARVERYREEVDEFNRQREDWQAQASVAVDTQ